MQRSCRELASSDNGEGQGCIFMERRLQSVLSLANLNLASSNLVKEQGNGRCSVGMFLYPYTLLYIRVRSGIYIFGVGFWCCSFNEERAMREPRLAGRVTKYRLSRFFRTYGKLTITKTSFAGEAQDAKDNLRPNGTD